MAEPPAEPSVLAARGIGILVGRTLSLQLLTAAVTIVLARLLSPADYGLFAVAAAVQSLAQAATDMGMTASLIRLPEDPSPQLQVAVRSFLVLGGSGIGVALLAVAFLLLPALGAASEVVEVTAVAAIAVPIYAVRAVPMVLLERHLKFGRVAVVETSETLTFNAFALLGALAGLGAYSLAGAVPAAALAGAISVRALQGSPRGFAIDLAQVRRLGAFGVRVSLYRMLGLARELGFVTLITAIGGTSVAGFYAMAGRLFAFPTALASAVQRVTFPALSRSPRARPPRAARGAILAATIAALPLAVVAGSSHSLVTVLLGDRWLPTVDIVLIASAAMLLGSSAVPAMSGLAFAEGRPNGPIASVLTSALAMAVACLTAVASLGASGVGIAMLASTLSVLTVLAIATDPPLRRALPAVGGSLAIGVAAGATGYLPPLGDGWPGLLARIVLSASAWLALEMALDRPRLRDAAALVRSVLRPASRTAASQPR